ncbi:hypothetical protein IAT38_005096 [Cryptococcus sp. DSM 104549]
MLRLAIQRYFNLPWLTKGNATSGTTSTRHVLGLWGTITSQPKLFPGRPGYYSVQLKLHIGPDTGTSYYTPMISRLEKSSPSPPASPHVRRTHVTLCFPEDRKTEFEIYANHIPRPPMMRVEVDTVTADFTEPHTASICEASPNVRYLSSDSDVQVLQRFKRLPGRPTTRDTYPWCYVCY